jgi:putative hydrolase of the HAD superfamily
MFGMKTRFVYFDLGNVLACFCLERLLRQVADIVGCSADEIKLAYFEENGLQQRLERGDIGTDEYFERICERLGSRPEKATFFRAINDIFWLNERIVPYLNALAAVDFPRGILSNTGPNHWNFCVQSFPILFETIPTNHIASYKVRELKPDRGIFEAAIRMAQTVVPDIVPGEILFFDDLPKNVQGAIDCGLDAVLYHDQIDMAAELGKRIPGIVFATTPNTAKSGSCKD